MPPMILSPGETMDPRLATITLEQILRHQAGWNVDRDVDSRIWQGVWQDNVRDPQELFRYGLGVPLAGDPGTVHAYTNYDTQTLARYIEEITGTEYEAHVKAEILTPAGITGMRYGFTALANRPPEEVRIMTFRAWSAPSWIRTVVTSSIPTLPVVGSPLRSISCALFGLWRAKVRTTPLLSESALAELQSRDPVIWPNDNYYAGLHWYMRKGSEGYSWVHDGRLEGHYARLIRRDDGVSFAFLINRTKPAEEAFFDLEPLFSQVDFPEHDLFGMFGGS